MRKKLLLFLMALMWLPLYIQAFTIDGIQYVLNSNTNSASVSGYEGEPTDIVIPATISHNGNQYPVTSIRYGAFYSCPSLSSVVIPHGVTSIENDAFWHCTSLISVVIPEGVTSIGLSAFSGCSSLTSVVIPEGVTSIAESAFNGCSSLTSVVIPEGVTSIGNYAFRDCSSLTLVEIPEGVTSIGEFAFYRCSSLTSVVIPEGVTSIGKDAFYFCRSLTSVVIPEGVTSIAESTFNSCNSLTSVVIPASVTSIGEDAFSECNSLTSVVISEGVTSIGGSAFRYCNSLQLVVIPESVDSCGGSVFGESNNYLRVLCTNNFDKSLLEGQIWEGAFYTYDGDYEILDDLTVLTENGKRLLMVPLKIEKYTIPDGVEIISSRAFERDLEMTLKSLTVPASVKIVETDAFVTTWEFERVNFIDWNAWYENVKLGNINANPYRFCGAYAGGVKVSVPELKEGMTEIKDYVNMGLEGYKDEVELPSTLKRVGAYAFYNNKELSNVFLNEGLEEIGEHAFFGCELLENQKMPSSLKKIEDNAYEGCTSLTEVVLPEGLATLGNGVFKNCGKLEKAVVVCDIDSVGDELFRFCRSLDKLYLPLNLKKIGSYAFSCCPALDEISLPSSLESIGEYAFAGGWEDYMGGAMGSLSNLVIPNSVTSIGQGAFRQNKIGYLSLGNGLVTIPSDAFGDNPLDIIEFSEGLVKIEEGAFAVRKEDWYQPSLKETTAKVIIPSTVKEIEEKAFANRQILELVIPDGVMTLPSRSCGFPSMLTIGSGIKEIAADAFSFDNLITFRLMATMPPTLSNAFPLTTAQNDQLTLVVNQGRKDRYTTNARWKQIANIIEVESTDVTVYLDGTYALAEEIRMQSGLMPSRVNKLKVVGPLDDLDLRVIKENMVSLRSIDLSEVTNITEIPARQFSNSLLSEIRFPAGIEGIGDAAFNNCRLLQISELPESLKVIGSYAFSNCPGLTIRRLPSKAETLTIGAEAFRNCTGIREMVIDNENLSLGSDYYIEGASIFSDCSLLEHIDLSATNFTRLPSGMFSGCHELDKVLLPETIKSIGTGAFSGTAIRDLSFLPTGVETIDQSAFSNCRRLVAANLPKNINIVHSGMFGNCSRLLTVSMPSGITGVGQDLVNGDMKLSNISCAAVVAPEAETRAFDNIRLSYVSLTVPQLSFRSYISAPQWGKFESIQNRIPVEIDGGVEVSNVNEDDYQDMVREDELEAAQEAAAQEQAGENSEQLRRRAARRAAARANTRSFASLFDGAQINCSSEGSGTRIFLNPEENVKITSVKFNGKEMLSNLENNSLLLPAGSTGSLEIRTNYNGTSSIETISSDIDFDSDYDVYDLNGLLIGHDKDSLNAGIYIMRQGAAVKKINVK